MNKILFLGLHEYKGKVFSPGECFDFEDRADILQRWIIRGNLNVSKLSENEIDSLRKKYLSKETLELYYKSFKKHDTVKASKDLADKLAKEKAEKESLEKAEKEKILEKIKLDKEKEELEKKKQEDELMEQLKKEELELKLKKDSEKQSLDSKNLESKNLESKNSLNGNKK